MATVVVPVPAPVKGMGRNVLTRVAVVAGEDEQFRSAVREYLVNSASSWRCEAAEGGADALARMEMALQFGGEAALVLDRVLPDLDADEVAEMMERTQPGVEVVMLDRMAGSAKRSQSTEVLWRAVRYADERVGRSSATGPEEQAARMLPEQAASRVEDRGGLKEVEHAPLPAMIGNSASMCRMYRLVRLVAQRETTVLITGETGTGKELVARALHQLSGRADRPFVTVNCSAIPDSLLESELFGYAKGAFTGAMQSRIGRIQAAEGGTLFLDEIGELSPSMQAKLLRFLQEGEVQRLGETEAVRVNVRVIAATNIDLGRAARERSSGFRQDLYYRLAVFPIELPELRQREADALLLARYFLARYGMPEAVFSPAAERALLDHAWPGNVRELQHAVERAVILAEGERTIRPEHLVIQ